MSTFFLPGSSGIPEDRKPKIAYPCTWTYTLIGRSPRQMREAALQVLGPREHDLARTHASPGGKYHSMQLEVVVESEAERLRFFADLAAHEHVRFVL